MKLAIISSRYPSEQNFYAHTFVHARSRFFKAKGAEVSVYVPASKPCHYVYQGVDVYHLDARDIAKKLSQYDLVYFHLLNIYPQPWLSGAAIYKEVVKHRIPSAFYIHGSEVQKYFSRRFDSKLSFFEAAKLLYKDFFHIPIMKKYVNSLMGLNCVFITPSKWMEQETIEQLGLSPQKFNAHIIPNGINTQLFKPLSSVDNKKILCIRPLSSNKYAVDIAIKTMVNLPEFTMDIYGQGPKKDEYQTLINSLGLNKRVSLKSEFIQHDEMPRVMHKYSYFMSPTRMDAQGVTMCEALSAGRIVISSDNTAIPEFIEDGVNGICKNGAKALAEAVNYLEADKALKHQMSEQAVTSMLPIDDAKVLEQELVLLTHRAKAY